ncbi:hypothetical protein J4Q44_G00391980 [Coregonus suidteri]|uniref:Uncharacterized protein n=1 Tax=Coregonus suidteri TaxID=861788 RepID=A0AAN8Q3K5_9TELE
MQGEPCRGTPGREGCRQESDLCPPPHPVPEHVLLVLDRDAGTLGYVVDDCFLGVAFKDLPRGVELFPAVSSVRDEASIRLCYLNGATRRASCTVGSLRSVHPCVHGERERLRQTDCLCLFLFSATSCPA